MPKTSKVKKSKKPKRTFDATGARVTATRRPPPANRAALNDPILRARADDSPALKKARAAFIATMPESARPALERLISDPDHRAAFNAYRAPVSKLDAARGDFDAAILGAVKACLALAGDAPAGVTTTRTSVCAQDAGFALQDAAAALLRAREEAAPIPLKLTPKGEAVKFKSKAPVGFDDSGPLRGRSVPYHHGKTKSIRSAKRRGSK